MDIPFRFLTLHGCGAFILFGVKIPGADGRIGLLKAQYDEAWQLAADEDREKAAIRFVPRRMYIT
jgi:hypothetical protein